ncbi:putative cell adhesion molecule 2-like isoform X1 [Penaeus vannamei]|uniref:Putative cell adhesion molecule 2-like isoform X1 n=1 Tax=Penaeus vannamei TaxID=6689 RepID=A0A3R7NTD3_PENVA|nr:uncharacterized protein LOC113819142 [Penaeus vannamei]ROT66200.1 putative cell adhesion molecule 2-like isoform X1 [Penaeus vannamei]
MANTKGLFTWPCWFVLATSWAVLGTTSCVRIKELDVPAVALVNDKIHLRCDYEEEGMSRLYTLKWYKDGKEFYRYQPGISAHSSDDRCADDLTYDVAGVNVDCWVSTERDVVLQGISNTTSGDYQCEVIGEHPMFRKEIRVARLTVFSESLEPPVVSGVKESYRDEDEVTLNCSSRNAEYVPVLTWLLNGRPAAPEQVRKYPERWTIGLAFQTTDQLFRRGYIEVACVSSLGAGHQKRAEVQLVNHAYLRAQEYHYNAGRQRNEGLRACAIVGALTFIILNHLLY